MESHGFMILHRSCLMTTAHWDANPRELNHFESRSTLPMGVNHFLTPVGSKIITSNGWWIQKKKTGLRLQANDEAAVAHKNYLSLTLWSFNIAMENHHFEEVNHLFLWAIYTMAMLVITRGYHLTLQKNMTRDLVNTST